MKNLLLALALATLIPLTTTSEAQAGGNGGGGAKAPTRIRVLNSSANTVAVIIDATQQFADLTQFQNAGGRLLNAGESTHFHVTAGNHIVYASIINTTTGTAGNVGTQNVVVPRNSTIQVNVSGGTFPNAPTF